MAKIAPAIENEAKTGLRTLEALVVKSVAKGFRRIGLAFTREAVHLDPSLLTPEQLAALTGDANLVVSRATVTVPADRPTSDSPVVVPVEAPAAAAADDGNGEAK